MTAKMEMTSEEYKKLSLKEFDRAAAFEKRIGRVIAWSIFPNFRDVILSASSPADGRRMKLTDKENACNHCNCGNVKLTFDTFMNWIMQMKENGR